MIPLTHGCFVYNYVEIDPVVLKKKIFKCRRQYFFLLFGYELYVLLEKGMSLHWNKPEFPSGKNALYTKKMKMLKLKFTTMTTTTYDRKLTQDASDWILSQCKGPRLNIRVPLWSWAGSCPTSSLSICLAIYFRLGLFRWIPSPKQTLSLKKGRKFLLPIGKRQSTISVYGLSSVVR